MDYYMWVLDISSLNDYYEPAMYRWPSSTPHRANNRMHPMSDDNVPNVYEFSEAPADAVQPPLLTDGEYRAVVRSAEQAVSKSSGNNMLKLEYVISADEYPADFSGDPDGTKLTGYIMLSDDPTGRYRYKKACETHGVVPAKRVNAQDFMGQEVIVRVKSSSYQGELRYDPANAVRAA